MLTNILIISLLVLLALIGAWRGMARTLLNFAAVVLCSIVSDALSGTLAQWIYTSFFRQDVIDSLQRSIDSYGVDAATANSLDSAPSWITGLLSPYLNRSGMSLKDLQASLKLTNDPSLSIAQNLEKPIGQLSTTVIALLISIFLFILLFALCKPLIRHAVTVFRIPVISQIDSVLGGVIGFAEGVVLLLFAINFFYLAVSAANPKLFSNTELFGELFNLFCFFS